MRTLTLDCHPPYLLPRENERLIKRLNQSGERLISELNALHCPSFRELRLRRRAAEHGVPVPRSSRDRRRDPLAVPMRPEGRSGFGWPEIGPVRGLYYRELILGTHFDELVSESVFANKSLFVHGGAWRDPCEWLVYDRYLAKTLMSIGLSWRQVETTMVQAFADTLGLEPRPELINDWVVQWTAHAVLRSRGDLRRVRRDERRQLPESDKSSIAEKIIRGRRHTYRTNAVLHFDGRMLPESDHDRRVWQAMFAGEGATQTWQAYATLLERRLSTMATAVQERRLESGFMKYSTVERSPFADPVIRSLVNLIFSQCQPRTETERIHQDRVPTHSRPANENVLQIIAKKSAWLETGGEGSTTYYRAAGLYYLVADLIYHLPVILALPELRRKLGARLPDDRPFAPPVWPGLTASEVRQRNKRGKQHKVEL